MGGIHLHESAPDSFELCLDGSIYQPVIHLENKAPDYVGFYLGGHLHRTAGVLPDELLQLLLQGARRRRHSQMAQFDLPGPVPEPLEGRKDVTEQ